MKRSFLFVAMLFATSFIYSQISYEKGYYLDQLGKRHEGFIKNLDWRDNPTSILFSNTENGNSRTIELHQMSSFGISNDSRFRRATVQIDRSSKNLNELKFSASPEFQTATVMLKELIKGELTLYKFSEGQVVRYFYGQQSKDSIIPLVHKKYKSGNGSVAYNNEFRSQLYKVMGCENIDLESFKTLDYIDDDLIAIFLTYNNECGSQEIKTEVYQNSNKKIQSQLYVVIGMGISDMDIKNGSSSVNNAQFEKKTGVKFGLESEFRLPFNKYKWGLVFGVLYRSYDATQQVELVSDGLPLPPLVGARLYEVDYTSLEIPFGFRHHFLLNNDSSLFISILGVADVLIGDNQIERSFVVGDGILESLDIGTDMNFSFGLGYTFSRFTLEARYSSSRELLNTHLSWDSKYNDFSIFCKYRFM
jgi:hypothetical protein